MILVRRDLEDSFVRHNEVFYGQYGRNVIFEGNRPIGSVRIIDDVCYVTFRASVNSLWEILTCAFVWKRKATLLNLPGKVHAGIYGAFEKSCGSYDVALRQAIVDNQGYMPRRFIFEGISRGSGIATLMAAYEKKKRNVEVDLLRYSAINIFDHQAAKGFIQKVGLHHCNSFNTVQDKISQIAGPKFLGFAGIGYNFRLDANQSKHYRSSIKLRHYCHLPKRGIVSAIFKFFIPVSLWQSHMPVIYQEIAPKAFEQYQIQSLCAMLTNPHQRRKFCQFIGGILSVFANLLQEAINMRELEIAAIRAEELRTVFLVV